MPVNLTSETENVEVSQIGSRLSISPYVAEVIFEVVKRIKVVVSLDLIGGYETGHILVILQSADIDISLVTLGIVKRTLASSNAM